ncbi:hypothetical protein BGZ65_004614 [Modicella reniformis]|uniref:Uncharacterized protein n=1 Tax=Modicella reniformis TaxID=1440133 RepID=A0A9P6J5Y1_9FUNG|nr:hypothetical protein BGZ65_004614 [Modicella reniformis]
MKQYAQMIANMDLSNGILQKYTNLHGPFPEGKLDVFQSIGGQNGETGFAFILVTNNTTQDTKIYGLYLDRGLMGEWQQVGYNLNVTDNGIPSPLEKSSSTGLIVGCVLGVVVLIAAIAYFGYYRRVVLKRKMIEQTAERQQDSAAAGMTTNGTSSPGGPEIYQGGKFLVDPSRAGVCELQKRPYDPIRDGKQQQHTSSSSTSIPISTISTLNPDPRMQQQFRFTSHPRPNFVTTISTSNLNGELGATSSPTISSKTATPRTAHTKANNPHSLLRPGSLSMGPASPQEGIF